MSSEKKDFLYIIIIIIISSNSFIIIVVHIFWFGRRVVSKNFSLCIMGFTGTSPYPTLPAFVQTERRCILGYEKEKVLDEAWFLCVWSRKYKLLRVEI